MDFSAKLDDLQRRAAHAQAAAQAAVSESREQLRQRIDQAKVDVDLAAMDARQQVGEAAASARSKWAQMKADAADTIEFAAWTVDTRGWPCWTPSTAGSTPTNSPSKGGGNEQNRGPHRRRPS